MLNIKYSISPKWAIILSILIFQFTSTNASLKDDCFDLPSTLCGNSGSLILTPLNKNPKLIGWWTFDDLYHHDSSGRNLDGQGDFDVGPSAIVKGYSAHFNGSQMMTVDHHSDYYEATDLTISFWIYLLEDSTGNWRTILQKGDSIQEMTPTIMLWPKERRLHIRASTGMFWNEGIESKALVNLRQWTFISVVISGQMMQLYINGSLDSQMILKGKVKMNNGKLHIGKDPWHQGVKCYLDELKIHSRALRSKEIEAEATISNALIGPKYTTLGCESCTFVQALNVCVDGYHMCSYSELYSGGYLIARRNGWFKYNTEVWARETQSELEKNKEANEIGNPNVMKMCLCCSDK